MEAEWHFGSDQAYDSVPVRFPTVHIVLEETGTLDDAADGIRMHLGKLPLFTPNENGEYNDRGWYNFSIGLNGYSETNVDNCIEFDVCEDVVEDDYEVYDIFLSKAEQLEIKAVLDEQLKEYCDTSCAELLEEARQHMIEYEEWKREYERTHNDTF